MIASACGKVIVLGEHAVVYGRPCIAAGLRRGVEAHAVCTEDPTDVSMMVLPWKLEVRVSDGTDLGRALADITEGIRASGPGPAQGARVEASILLPGTGGLGSSAALGIAVIRTLYHCWYAQDIPLAQTLALGRVWEQVFHGNPSGVDHTVAACGGAGVFTRADGFAPLRLRHPVHLAVGDTGERTPTKEMVASVARQRERKPENTEKTLDAIGVVVRNGALAMADDDLRALGQLMDMNQSLLSGLMLSTERTELLCAMARDVGALGAKLTGGGGGGCVIALARTPEHVQEILDAWQRSGISGFATMIANEQTNR